MDIHITTRHGTLPESVRGRAEERLLKLGRYEPRLISVRLVFNEDHPYISAEAKAEVPATPTLVARASGQSYPAVLNQVVQRLARQLKKERSKRVDHQAEPAGAAPES